MYFFACLPLCACQSDSQARCHGGGAFRGRAPSNHCLYPPKRELCPPSEDCTPKKETSLMPLGCSSRPETIKILVITPEFVGKNRLFADFAVKTFLFSPLSVKFSTCFAMKTFVFWSSLSTKFLCPPKLLYAPSSHASLAPGLAILMILFCMIMLNMRYYW